MQTILIRIYELIKNSVGYIFHSRMIVVSLYWKDAFDPTGVYFITGLGFSNFKRNHHFFLWKALLCFIDSKAKTKMIKTVRL